MMEPVKILNLEMENVKRVKAVALTPAPTGLTVIGGDNRQGKTSILDGIVYALGGERHRPTNLQREDGQASARIEVVLSNGLKVERKGKNCSLTVTDTTGARQGQRLLDSFVEELALDLPKFMRASGREKATVLLHILGIEEELAALDREEKAAYNERTTQGRIAAAKKAHAEALPEHHDAPTELISAAELVAQAQAAMARNAERQAARNDLAAKRTARDRAADQAKVQGERVTRLREELAEAERRLEQIEIDLANAADVVAVAEREPVGDDESTTAIESAMAELETTNAKVRENLAKRKAMDDAQSAADTYEHLTAKIEEVRARRAKLLEGADLPLPGLSVVDGELTLDGKAWDCMSSAEQVRAAVAIVRRLKPECGFVLLDGLETFDTTQLAVFGEWLAAEGMQAIATRVSRGDECTIVIEDGMVEQEDVGVTATAVEQDW